MARGKSTTNPETVWLIVGLGVLAAFLVVMLAQVLFPSQSIAPLGRVTDIVPEQMDTLFGLEAAASMRPSAPPLTAAQEVTLRLLEERAGIQRN
ncbi:MAG: hypothetical protein FJY98_01280 [Candidatus Liptonbacteria bacterium]|nr:hypothetical protein [Candidatus Liptonbacteria bacterium]